MTGWLAVAGLGPGAERAVTPEVASALAEAMDVAGYAPYVARVAGRPGLVRHGNDRGAQTRAAAPARPGGHRGRARA